MVKLLIKACIVTIRPLLGPEGSCRYQLSCSDYANLMLKDKSLFSAVPLIILRVVSCNPVSFALEKSIRSIRAFFKS